MDKQQLPEAWERLQLRNVCKLINGRAYKQAELLNEGKYPVLRVGNFFSNRSWYYSDLELDEDKYCDDGDLLYAWSASFGPRIWQGGKVIYHYHIWKTELDSNKIHKKFLYYWFEWDSEKIKAEQGVGTTMIHVTKGAMEERILYLPPLDIQKQIVAILDESFEGIDQAIRNTEKNLANARELFDSYLNNIFTKKGEGWEERRLGDICSIKHGFAFKSQFFTNEKSIYILLTPGSFYESGGYRDQGEKTKYYIGNIPEGFILKKGDFLFAMTEQAVGLLGSSLVVPESDKYLHNQRLGLVQVVDNFEWHNDFFFHQFNTEKFRAAVQSSASGVKVRHTSPNKLGAIIITFPKTLQEQKLIADDLNSLYAETQRLEAIYRQKLASLNELKQSILQKAFTGQLTRKSC